MVAQTLIFCVGAAKAGTSWLFDYLYQREDCHLSPVKELHYFDSLELGRGGFYRDENRRRLVEIRGRHAVTDDPEVHAYQAHAIADLRTWIDQFDGKTRDDAAYLDFLGRGRDGARVIGDFTPAYALLKEKTFAQMAGLMERVRFVYLLREPVDRLWSHLRMDAGKGGHDAALAKMDSFIAGGEENVARRGNYRRTLNRLWAAMPRTALHVEFYERLFTPEAIERLCGFLGLPVRPADFAKQVHVSKPSTLDADRRAKAEAVLKPQYNFVKTQLGGLPAEWQTKMVTA